ncbi:MAG: hypothetical protein JXN60_07510 [Lentisphaerae bacterium]|nr:hypothetical protein [Lentisphaerota bacterium]
MIVQAKKKTTDKKWKKYRTVTMAGLKGFETRDAIKINQYGGRTDKLYKATGFFRVMKKNKRWIMTDPDGCQWYQVGCNHVVVNHTKQGQKALAGIYGSKVRWAKDTAAQLRSLGFNMLGCWSNWRAFQRSAPMPYTTQSDFMREFAKKMNLLTKRGRDYKCGFFPVLHPAFPSFCNEHAKKMLADTRNDPWLVGHFSDNELYFTTDMLKRCLSLPQTDPNHQAARKWMIEHRISSMKSFPESIKLAFVRFVAETYFKNVSKAIKAADPNHLYLGSRFALDTSSKSNVAAQRPLWEVAGKYVDIISMNWYRKWTPDKRTMNTWNRWSNRPFVITEWYAKGMDSGMRNITGWGWTVKTQKDRGRFYQNFAIGLTKHPACVGWHWFKYMDNDTTDKNADPSNRNSNKGIVNCLYVPYLQLIGDMKELNDQIYPLLDYFHASSQERKKP